MDKPKPKSSMRDAVKGLAVVVVAAVCLIFIVVLVAIGVHNLWVWGTG